MSDLKARLEAFAVECDELDRMIFGGEDRAPLLREAVAALAMERALRQRIDLLTAEHAEERVEWKRERSAFIRDVTMMANAAGVDFDAPEQMAEDIQRKIRDYEQTIQALEAQCKARY